MVLVLIEGVVKVSVPVPLAKGEPPLGFAYQSMVSPVPTVAEILTVPVPHLEAFTAVGALGWPPLLLTVTEL